MVGALGVAFWRACRWGWHSGECSGECSGACAYSRVILVCVRLFSCNPAYSRVILVSCG